MSDLTYAVRRFWKKVAIDDNGCWLWSGAKKSDGYGQFKFNGKMVLAHRWAFDLFIVPIPEGLEIDHACKRRECVNPAHLEPVTHAENMGRARKSHCKYGHPLFGENLTVYERHGRTYHRCKKCVARAQRDYQARKRMTAR